MAKRSDVSAKQRSEAVLALLRREEPAAQLARRHGVSEQTLYRWRDEFLAGGEAALSGKSKGSDAQARRVPESATREPIAPRNHGLDPPPGRIRCNTSAVPPRAATPAKSPA